jgi:site-specific recombinase XerD
VIHFTLKLASHLWQSRHGIFYIRYNHNGHEIKRSLKTRDLKIAQKLAYILNAMNINDVLKKFENSQISELILKTDGIEIVTDGSDTEHKQALEFLKLHYAHKNSSGDHSSNQSITANQFAELLMNQQKANAQFNSKIIRTTLKEAVDQYLDDRKKTISERTYSAWQGEFKHLIVALGENTIVADISKDAYIHFRKRVIDILAPSSMDSRNSTYRNFFKWCIEHGRAEVNPVVALNLSRVQKAKFQGERGKVRKPFEASDLEKLFNDDVMQAIKKPCLFWMPLLAFFSGAREEELAEIKVDTIIPYETNKYQLHIGKSKTLAGIRFIPIHPKLIEIGFLDYVDEVKKTWGNSSTLFPYMTPVKERLSHKFSQEFGAHRTKLGIGKEKDFHSFRPTVIGVLKLNNVNSEFRREFVGHDSTEKEDTHLKNYARKTKFPLQHLEKEVLDKLDYAYSIGFNLPNIVYRKGRFTRYLKSRKIQKQDLKIKKSKALLE